MTNLSPVPRGRRLRVGVHVGQLVQSIPGGIGRVTKLLCDELPRFADVVAFSSGPRGARRALAARLGAEVEFRSIGRMSPRWRYEMWNRYRRPLDLHVDVCHAPSLAVPPSTAPLVVSINDVVFLRHAQTLTPHGVRFHERGLALARREAAAIIVPSSFTRDELVREGFAADRIHCVPLAVTVPRVTPARGACDRRRERGVSGPYLLVAGTIEPRKDHATIVAAFEQVRRRHPDLLLVVAGPPGWSSRGWSSRGWSSRGWSSRGWSSQSADRLLHRPGVVALGQVPDAELDLLYRHATVVVSASIYEGFGLTVLEALTRGRPVVASAIPAHEELAAGAARMFAPGDADGLASVLDQVLDDPAAHDELRRAALERAQHFSVAATIAGHVAAYERAAGGG